MVGAHEKSVQRFRQTALKEKAAKLREELAAHKAKLQASVGHGESPKQLELELESLTEELNQTEFE